MYAKKLYPQQHTTPSGNYVYFYAIAEQVMAHLVCSIVGHLAIIESQAELDQLNRTGTFWVDMNDINAEGTWVSSFTGGASFTSWDVNQGQGGTNENCGAKTENNGTMGDFPCAMAFAYICEI